MFKRNLAALLIAAPAFAFAGGAAAQDADTVVATVNGVDITLGQMVTARQLSGIEVDQASWDQLLDNLIQQAALAAEGEREMTLRDQAAIELERRRYLAFSVLERIVAAEPTDAEIQTAYDEVFGGFEPVTEYHAAHILLETEEAARDTIAELEGGADFATVAEERSTGPTGPTGGDLGWFAAAQMVPPFAEAIEAMEPGDLTSEPVQTQFGWHVIKLHETRQSTPPELAEVREQLAEHVQRGRVEAEVSRIVDGALIERNEELSYELMGDDSILGVE
ncbi:MAG: peptidylprolyl isomerase [Paracoccus sp. (in: a-proteobacteria)]|nr:peptidylprolyl isomerase [Paracoccus sp. (in: a-proteobacteria)]